MKTTVLLDDTVFQEAKIYAAKRGESLSSVLNQSLRLYIRAESARRGPALSLVIPVYGGVAAKGPGLSPAELALLRDEGN